MDMKIRSVHQNIQFFIVPVYHYFALACWKSVKYAERGSKWKLEREWWRSAGEVLETCLMGVDGCLMGV